jgi:putative cardiolipin synthase
MLEGTGAGEGTLLRLHTKAAVIDGAKVFIGSVNFDPRSEALNTEFGVFVDSPVLAAQALAIFARMRDDATWRVRLKPDTERDLQWVRSEGEKIVELIELEPGADLWTRAKLYIQSFVIPESLL